MATYISLNDDLLDPTYDLADKVILVDVSSSSNGENPCTLMDDGENPNGEMGNRITAPVLPMNREECERFAKIQGWDFVVENGQISFRTGILYK